MIMFAQCPKCGGQLTEHKYTVPMISKHTLDRCMNCGWYMVETSWLIETLTDEKDIYQGIADIAGDKNETKDHSIMEKEYPVNDIR